MSDRSFENILSSLSARTIAIIACTNGWNEDVALEKFISSKVYSCLEREETKVWHFSALTLANLFDDEQKGQLEWPEV